MKFIFYVGYIKVCEVYFYILKILLGNNVLV